MEDGDGEHEGAQVGGGLAGFYACDAEVVRQDDDQGDEEDASAAGSEHVGAQGHAAGLHHHVAKHAKCAQWHGCQLPSQCVNAY